MSFPHDRTSLGDLIAQHHDPFGTWSAEQGSRRRSGRVRFLGFDRTTGEPVFDRHGWDHGGVCWLATGNGNNLDVPVWQQAFPALIVPPRGTTSGPGYKTNVAGPLAQPVLKQVLGVWTPDEGLLAQAGALPFGIQLPYGYPVAALGMSTLDEQQLALLPAGGILIAVKSGGLANGVYGTKVFDIRAGALDNARWARDHSHWCVYLLPREAPVGFSFGGQLVQAKLPGGAAPGGLAWELGPDVDNQGGHGVVSDLPSIAGVPAPTIVQDGPVPGPGRPGLIPVTIATFDIFGNPLSAAQIQQNIKNETAGITGSVPAPTTQEKKNPNQEVPKTQEKKMPGGVPKTVSGSPPVLAVSSYRGRGPLNVGQVDDPHRLAFTPDNVPCNSLHEDEGALVVGETGDAPRKHDKGAWVTPRPDGPFAHEVYHRNDPSDKHDWFGKEIPGFRKWQGTDFMDVPTPAQDPKPGDKIATGPKPDPIPGPKDPEPKWPPFWPPIVPPDPNGPKPDPNPGDPPEPLPPDYGDIADGVPDGVDGSDKDPPPSPPPGGYFGPGGQPLIFPPDAVPGVTPGQLPGPTTGGLAQDGPTPPENPGGSDDAGGRQRSYPAMGTAMGFYELIGRGVPIEEVLRDPRYQFDPYTPDERHAYDNGPVGTRIGGFVETEGGVPTYDGPQCGPGDMSTGTSPHSGISFGTSDFDLRKSLQDQFRGEEPQRPRNTAIVNHERNVDGAFGDTNPKGLPANGFRYGRSYDDETGDKYASLHGTDEDGHNLSETPDVLIDFLLEKAYLWGEEVITEGTLPAAGVTGGPFGDGSDGAATLNGGAAPSGMSFDGGITYTMSRDCYFSNLTMTGAYRLVTDGWRLFVNGTLTLGASNRINNDGIAAAGGAAGTVRSARTVGGSTAGATSVSRNSVGGTPGIAASGYTGTSFGGSGGAGGNSFGLGPFGGAGGANTAPAAAYGELRQTPQMTIAVLQSYQGQIPLDAGAGGGGGAVAYTVSDSGTHTSGAGGGGAGVLMIAAKTLVNAGIIACDGGPGGGASTTGAVGGGGAGGGGGGGGGLAIVVYGASGSTIGTVQANGGNGGAAIGTGTPGVNGSAGRVRTLAV
jgi:hypothetical protein